MSSAPEVGGGARHWPEVLTDACRGYGLWSAFQPIVDVARGVTVGYEALARFEGGAERSPAVWFAAAREHGRRADLEAAALRSALRSRRTLPPNCFLSINVSPDLLPDERVRAVWREHEDLSGVVIELTEQAPIDSYGALEGDLTALRAAGALIAVDDAGAGYAGLRHLLVLRPAIIKLDRELVCGVDVDEAKLALVEMLGTFADRIDAWVLAEGVERQGELDALAALGVPLAQGYLLARPGPAWPEIDPRVAQRLGDRRTPRTSGTVRDLVDAVPTATSALEAAALFGDDHVQTVVVTDERRRPHAVFHPDMLHLGVSERGMCVNADTPVRDVLRRALTRDAPRRFEPLLCTDESGRLLGVVRIERLTRAALDPSGAPRG